MSNQKRPLSEVYQTPTTTSRRGPSTPHILRAIQERSATRPRSAFSSGLSDPSSLRPNSARGILRRLAKITAPTTKRRIVTPSTTSCDKENGVPDEEDDEGLKKPQINFNIEESIEEDDSEIPVAPTPSALLDNTDDEDDEQPEITFDVVLEGRAQQQADNRRETLLPQSDSILPNDHRDEGEDENSTFLTERGRRAVTEEPTRMSRYSFGSIRMSDFGTELEVRRESNRQQVLVALKRDSDYGGGLGVHDNTIQLGGDTENLRNLQQSPSTSSDDVEDVYDMGPPTNHDFQLELPDEEAAAAHEHRTRPKDPGLAHAAVVVDSGDDEGDEATPFIDRSALSAVSSRQQTLLESMVETAKPRPRKKLKMNQRGNMVPSLPSSLIKRVVNESYEESKKRKPTLGKDHMKALEQATEWFFEQVSEDLEAYSSHGKRKKRIDSDDVLLLMRRQRVLRDDGELRQLAKNWLPREVLNELDLSKRP